MISNVVNDPNSSGYLWRFWLFEDVTEEKRILTLAEKHGEQDALTLLHNRHRYDKDLLLLMAQAERDGARIALLVFDLDDFKPVNDLYGHAAGDVVLRQVAHTLSAQLRRNEVLYRIGGDEFSLVLINASDEEIKMLAERIVTTIDQLDFTFDGEVAHVGCSLGIARYPNDANTLQKLQQYADQAMYVAKKMGKGQFSFNNVIHDAWRELEQPVAELPFNEMALGISIMDAQHIAVARFIQGIIDSLMSGDKTTKLLKRVDMLIELCQINFQTEEDLMKRHDIPGVESYRADHQQRLASLRAIFGKLNFSEEQLPALARETNNWLMEHIRSQDKELASQLRKLGVS